MANPIQVPQPNPPNFQFQQPNIGEINSTLASKYQPIQYGTGVLSDLAQNIQQQRQQRVQNQLAALQAYTGIAQAVGPDAANAVAGQIPNMPNWSAPSQANTPAAVPMGGPGNAGGQGTNYGGVSQGTPQPQPNPNPNAGQTVPSSSSQGSPQTIGNGNQPQPTPTPPPQAAPAQPSPYIQASLAAGHPDVTNYQGRLNNIQNQMGQYANKGAWGKEQAGQLAQQVPIVTAQMNNQRESDQFNANQARESSQFATSDQRERNQFATSQANEKQKVVAGEISKQGPLTTEVNTLQGMFDNVDKNLNSYYQGNNYPGSANLQQITKGRIGSQAGATVLNQSAPLVAAINKSLTSRFNMGENELLSGTIAPSPNDTPKYAASKMAMLHQLIGAMQTGNRENVQNVAAAVNANVPALVSGRNGQ